MRSTSWLLGSVACAALLYGGASWWAGQQAQGVIEEAVAESNRQVQQVGGVQVGWRPEIIIEAYERGVFSSKVRYRLTFQDDDGQPHSWLLADDLQHGPFPWRELKAGRWAPQMASSLAALQETPETRAWFSWAGDAVPLTVRTRVGWRSDGESDWRFAALNGRSDEHVVAFGGGTLRIQFSRGLNSAQVDARVGELSWQVVSSDESIEAEGLSFTASSRVDGAGVEHTDAHIEASTLHVGQAGQVLLRLEGVQTDVQGTQREQRLDATVRYALGKVVAADYDAGRLAATLHVQRFDMAALMSLVEVFDGAQRRMGDLPADWGDLTGLEQAAVLRDMARLLEAGPLLSLDPVSWRNSAADSQLRLKLELKAAPGLAQGQLMALPDAVSRAELDVDVSRAMVVEAFARTASGDAQRAEATAAGKRWFDQWATQLQGLSLARQEGDRLLVNVVFEKGVLHVGGKPVPPWLLLPLLLSAG